MESEGLNIWLILWESGFVVKFVFILLILCSLVSWGIIFRKRKTLKELDELNDNFLSHYKSAGNLKETYLASNDLPDAPFSILFRKGYEELLKTSDKFSDETRKENMEAHFSKFGFGVLERALSQGVHQVNEVLEEKLTTLASIAAVAPFIGLFGTVWGIINAFTGLSNSGTSLDSVAPGIAEALVATAIGLAAAIPALWFYNSFSSRNTALLKKMESFGQEFLNMVERSLIGK